MLRMHRPKGSELAMGAAGSPLAVHAMERGRAW